MAGLGGGLGEGLGEGTGAGSAVGSVAGWVAGWGVDSVAGLEEGTVTGLVAVMRTGRNCLPMPVGLGRYTCCSPSRLSIPRLKMRRCYPSSGE